MPRNEPGWWYGPGGKSSWQARALAPVGALWGYAAKRRLITGAPYHSRLPVICVGNFTAGGTGKTPLCLFLLELLKQNGHAPVVLTRGYGAHRDAPAWVDPDRDTAQTAGDEPLLLARAAPVMVSRDRAEGARAIESGSLPASVIIMDDGLQNPSLEKTLSIAVIDASRGVGNGLVIPAGPLRAPLQFQLQLADAIVVNEADGVSGGGLVESLRQQYSGPILTVRTQPSGGIEWLKGTRVSAFCGIGNPGRFFGLLERCGANLVARESFPDHHVYTDAEARQLLQHAASSNCQLVTTEKDWVRLPLQGGTCADLRSRSRTVPIEIVISGKDQVALGELLARAPIESRRSPAGP